MRDLAGFAILLIALLFLIYLIGDVLLPLLVRYFLGVFLFFVIATILVLKGRQHPIHLESLLKPGVAPVLTALAVVVPLAHALTVWVFGGVENWWVLFAINGVFPVLWTARLLLAHRRQRALYTSEGHDLEDLLGHARKRDAALEVLDDALSAVEGQSLEPEPWEREVGLGPMSGIPDLEAVQRVRERIARLRAEYQGHAIVLERTLTSIGKTPNPQTSEASPLASEMRDALTNLEGAFDEVRRLATGILAEFASWSGVPRWEEVR